MQNIKTDILSLILLIILSAYMVLGKSNLLQASLVEASFLFAGFAVSLITYIFIEKPTVKMAIYVLASILFYFYSNNTYLLSMFLVGVSVSSLYFQTKLQDRELFSLTFLNVMVISGIILLNSLEKFRGFNKIDPFISNNIIIFLVITAIIFALGFKLIKKFLPLKKLPLFYENAFFVAFTSSVVLFSYFNFLEIGLDTILLPIIAGILTAYVTAVSDKNSKLYKAAAIILLLMTSYRVSGNAGIAIAFATSVFLLETVVTLIQSKKLMAAEIIFQITPLIFLFAITEIRENQGIITRLNLTSGYQIGWIILGTILLNYFFDILKVVKKFLLDNEIMNLSPLITTVFTVMLFTLIIKYGKEEGLTSLLIATVLYLISLNNLDYKRYKSRVRFLLAAANVLGVLSFLVLTKI